MSAQRRRCPVCWGLVARTLHDRIEGHWDTAFRPCPAGGVEYSITLARRVREAA